MSARSVFELTGDSVFGTPQSMQTAYEDTLVDIGRATNLGFEELRRANPGVDPWLPGEGTEILLPTSFVLPRAERRGIIINIAEYRVYFFYRDNGRDMVATVPASIGRMDWETPLGLTRVVAKARKPSWYPPESVLQEHADEGRELPRVVPPGPDNPLGDYAIRLALPGYLIHGTNRPAGVGMRVTHGCVRLFPEDIEWLFPLAGIDMPVRIVNQSVKFGWRGDELFLEVHPPLETVDGDTANGLTAITEEYVRATGDSKAAVDWDLILATFEAQLGIPVNVGRRLAEPEPVADEANLAAR